MDKTWKTMLYLTDFNHENMGGCGNLATTDGYLMVFNQAQHWGSDWWNWCIWWICCSQGGATTSSTLTRVGRGGACVKTGFLCSVSMLNDVHLCSNCFVYIVVVYVPSQSLTLTAYMSFRSCGRANFRKLEEYEFIDFVADKVPELQARAVSKPVWVQWIASGQWPIFTKLSCKVDQLPSYVYVQ